MAFDPLDRVNLGRSVEQALLDRPCGPLPPEESFEGAGVYAIYYRGTFPAYRPVAFEDCLVPIYVGKAVPPGARKGRAGLGDPPGQVLYKRLVEHADSIKAAERYGSEAGVEHYLRLGDFRCRFLVVEDIWIPLGEALLIQHFKPLWNQVVAGFGLHDPGGRRAGGHRSEWDELHPGRPWYDRMVAARSQEEVVAKVEAHLVAHPPPRTAPPTGTDTAASLAVELPEDDDDSAV